MSVKLWVLSFTLLLPLRASAAEAEHADGKKGVLLVIAGGVYGSVDGALAPNGLASVEVGYRFAWIDRAFGISIAPTYIAMHFAHATATASFAAALPLLASINFALGPGLFRAAGGPLIAYAQVTTADVFSTERDRGVGFGVEGFAAYLVALPFGALGLQASYRLVPYVLAHTAHTSDALSGELAFFVAL